MKFKILLVLVIFGFVLISYSSDVNAIKCSDTDGGQSFFSIGTVKDTAGGRENSYNDFCGDPDGVYEGYCENDNYNLVYKSCASFGKFVCSNGACIAGTPISYECSEDDGGLNIGLKGSTQYKWTNASGSGSGTRTDICLNSKQLNEAYCRNNRGDTSVINCGEGLTCYDGTCVKYPGAIVTKSCVDSDKGIIKETRGTISFSWSNTSGSGNSNNVDYCSALDEVNEYFCDGNNVGSQKVKCNKGDVCSNGICTSSEKKKVCQDSDGESTLIFGNTYGMGLNEQFTTYYDHCVGIAQVREYVCDDDGIIVRPLDVYCKQGYICSSGVCVLSGLIPSNNFYTCSETDAGKKSLAKGTTFVINPTGNIYKKADDFCVDKFFLNESFCGTSKSVNPEPVLLKSSSMNCRDYGDYYGCKDGECKLLCADRTVAGQCSLNKPSYCKEDFDVSGKISKGTATLISNCQLCGCPSNTPTCLPSGKCGGFASSGGISGKVVFNNPINLAALWLVIIMLLIAALFYFKKNK